MKPFARITSLFAMLLFCTAAFAQKTETRTPGTFTRIETGGSWDVTITKGSKDEVRLESSGFDLSKVITEVENRTLKIKLKDKSYSDVNFKVFITVRSLDALGAGGSGDVRLESDFGADDFNLGLSGSGSITTRQITASTMNIGMSGSGKITIAGGKAEELIIGQSGSGDLDALNLTAETVKIGKSGSGDTSIGVTESLTVGSSGSGDVYYRGNPSSQNIGVSGSSKVIKR